MESEESGPLKRKKAPLSPDQLLGKLAVRTESANKNVGVARTKDQVAQSKDQVAAREASAKARVSKEIKEMASEASSLFDLSKERLNALLQVAREHRNRNAESQRFYEILKELSPLYKRISSLNEELKQTKDPVERKRLLAELSRLQAKKRELLRSLKPLVKFQDSSVQKAYKEFIKADQKYDAAFYKLFNYAVLDLNPKKLGLDDQVSMHFYREFMQWKQFLSRFINVVAR